MFTPNEKYAALVEAAGYMPVALGPDDYIELLPACWRAVNSCGIKISHRRYDCEELNPLRMQPSGVAARKNLWEVRHDPYDVSLIFVRGPDGWITCHWRHLDRVPVPFGELAWDHARRQLAADGRAATEQQIADAVAGLLTRAYQGSEQQAPKMPRRDRRVAARTRAVTPPQAAGAGKPASGAAGTPAPPEPSGDGAAPAEVIPLGIFDPFREADRRW